VTIGTPKLTTPAYWSSGTGTVALPTGIAAGDFVVLNICGSDSGSDKREPVDAVANGWTVWKKTYSTHTWYRFADAAFLTTFAAGIPCKGRIVFASATSGVGAAGANTETPGATMPVAGACLLMFGRGKSALTPATGKLFTDVVNPSYDNRRNNVWFRAGTVVGYLAVDGTFNGTDSDGFVMIPKAGPNAPTLQSPALGDAVDYTAALPFVIVHNSAQNAAMEQLKLRVRMAAGSWSYLLADGTLTATETAVSTSNQTLTMNANLLTAGTAEWQAATYDNATWSPWADVQSFISTTRPTVAPTLTTGAGNLTPTVSWTETVEVAQRAYEARICPAADANWDAPAWQSLVQPGAALSVEAQYSSWTNGGSYKAWVQVTQQNGLKSVVTASAAATISWTAPTTPTVSAADQASGPVLVTVGSVGSGYTLVEVESSTDAGATWAAVASRIPTGTTETFLDPVAQYQDATRWRARAWNVVDGVSMPSAWATMSTDVLSTDTRSYLVSDTDHTDYVRVEVAGPTVLTPIEGYSVIYGMGADGPVVDRSERQGFSSSTKLQTLTQAEETALDVWLQAHGVFWFCWPPERDGAALVARPATRMMQAKAATMTPIASRGPFTERYFDLDWVGR
jgi:hypothetical protein